MTASGRTELPNPPELQLLAIRKRFGRNSALNGADFTLRAGTVHALLGENGAGKTTLMRIADGLLAPDGGEFRVRGNRQVLHSPADAIALGLGMVHQHFSNVSAMTVAENVALGNRGRYDRVTAEARVERLGAETGLPLNPRARVGELGIGAQQRLEIVKSLARDARVLILDEPTAVLTPPEADDLLRWLRSFADNRGSVVLITHKLHEALAIADDVTVLRRGRTVLEASARSLSSSALAGAMLGEAPAMRTKAPPATLGSVRLRLVSVTVRDERGIATITDVGLEVRGGEIMGVAGAENSGYQSLLRVIAGRTPPSVGRIEREGRVGFIPEDRQRDGLVTGFSLTENLVLKGAGVRRGRIRWRAERQSAEELVREFDVRPADVDAPAQSLSGGNQQKLVLARELSGGPAIIVAENPTRGLDIRATEAVHTRLRDAATSGMAVVVYSSDLDELLALATRVVVVHAGHVQAVPLDRDRVGRAMLGLP